MRFHTSKAINTHILAEVFTHEKCGHIDPRFLLFAGDEKQGLELVPLFSCGEIRGELPHLDHLRYMAPEISRAMLEGESYIPAAEAQDIWSLGMLIYGMEAGHEYPFRGLSAAEVGGCSIPLRRACPFVVQLVHFLSVFYVFGGDFSFGVYLLYSLARLFCYEVRTRASSLCCCFISRCAALCPLPRPSFSQILDLV